MRKKLIAILTVIVLTASVLAGCGLTFSNIKIGSDFEQKYDYVVRSNGGSAVQYGDYVYFINGYRGYDNTDGKQNNWNNDTSKGYKGGLYKAKLLGDRSTKNTREFDIVRNTERDIQFEFTPDQIKYEDEVNEDLADADKERIDVVNVQLIAPKVIGTSGYANGGIYIYDDFVYYASPNNTLNKQGTAQIEKTDFFRTKLDGTLTQLIFTTEGSAADKPYNFYKQGEYVYLVCYYDTTIVSVAMQEGKKKIGKPMKLTDEATSVLFAHKDVYDSKDNITNDPEDFIYFTRAVKPDDLTRSGNIIEACRPDGSENFIVIANSKTVTLEAVRGGGLFYRTSELGSDVIKFDNLHESLIEFSPTYAAHEALKNDSSTDPKTRKRYQINATVSADFTNYTSLYCFKDNLFANQCYIIAVSSSGVFLLSNTDAIRIIPQSAKIMFIEGSMVYYMPTDNNNVYRTDFTLSTANKADTDYELLTPVEPMASGYNPDYVAGSIFYFGRVDEWADAYGYFIEANRPGAKGKEVYMRSEADEKPEEDEDDTTTDDTAETE